MRRDAGRTFELQIWFMLAVIASFAGGWAWKPWGWLAGPVLLVGIFLFISLLGLVFHVFASFGKARVLRVARRQEAPKGWREFGSDARDASFSEAEKEELRRAAADPGHPAREALVNVVVHLGEYYKGLDPGAARVAEPFAMDRPDSEALPGVIETLARGGEVELLGRILPRILEKGSEAAKVMLARMLVDRGSSSYWPRHAEFAALVREWKAGLEPWLRDDASREEFRKLTST